MPPRHDAVFEADFRTRFLPLSRKIKKVENKLATQVTNSLANMKMSASYWNRQIAQLDALYAEMNLLFDKWSATEIPGRYRRSLRLINTRIRGSRKIMSLIGAPNQTLVEIMKSQYSVQMMRGLLDDAVESYLTASVAGKNNYARLFRRAQQMLVDESLINDAVVAGFQSGNLREAKSLISALFQDPTMTALKNKQFVQAGNFRYRPSYYAELLARTKFHQAHSQAALAQATNYDTDLVEVSSHNTTTAICLPFEGRIFSISGKDKMFPPLTDSPPYHPNCLHLIFPTFKEAMELDGTLESFASFSQGDIGTHPTLDSFIPVADRRVS